MWLLPIGALPLLRGEDLRMESLWRCRFLVEAIMTLFQLFVVLHEHIFSCRLIMTDDVLDIVCEQIFPERL